MREEGDGGKEGGSIHPRKCLPLWDKMFGGLKAIHMNHQRTRQERKPSCIQYIFKYGSLDAPLLPYCPGQVPMGAHSSSAKNWGWAVTQRKCLNGSTTCTPVKGPTPDAKLPARGYQCRLALSLRPCFLEASPTVEKAVSCYKADQLVASLQSFVSTQSLLAVRKF